MGVANSLISSKEAPMLYLGEELRQKKSFSGSLDEVKTGVIF
jgi:fructose-1,6-bisphosphatase/sedoheptulose 1,7-bisphosphatase-like protein